MKQCYYEILGVERDATSADLKKAYRVMSLKYHPDKNKDPDAKETFQNINEAYECLSDPNERTWYDNHRTQILSGKDEQNDEDLLEASFGGINVKKYMTSSCYNDFTDDKKGFYTVYRDFFEKIKSQEMKAFQQGEIQGDFYAYPGFGDSQTDPVQVDHFYTKWDNFTTYKNFSWADQMDEESRFVKRIIERENNSFRKKEKKAFLETIKKIVDFAFKKDPRYQEFLKKVNEEKEKKEKYKEEQKIIKEKQKKEMRIQQRLIEQQRLQEEAEMIKKGLLIVENMDQFDHIQDEQDLPDFYCQLCDKEYNNANALENHKNSKMHKKNLKVLLEQVGTEQEKQQIFSKQNNQTLPNQDKDNQNQEIFEKEEEELQINKKKKNKKNKQFIQQANKFDNFDKVIDSQKVPLIQEKQPEIKQNLVQEYEISLNGNEPLLKSKTPNEQRKKSSINESEDGCEDNFFTMMSAKMQKKNQKKGNKELCEIIQQEENKFDDSQIKTIQQSNKKSEDDKNQIKQTLEKPAKKKEYLNKIDQVKQGEIEFDELSKAKQKKLKKLEKEEQEKNIKFKCNVCKIGFPSKTKLFQHCEELKHFSSV